jgi:hypothetical protein
MLSSLSMYVRMLDGRDRGLVLEVNREIALPLIESKQAIPIEDVTKKKAMEPWTEDQLMAYLKTQTVEVPEVKEAPRASVETSEVSVSVPAPAVQTELSTARAKTKKR